MQFDPGAYIFIILMQLLNKNFRIGKAIYEIDQFVTKQNYQIYLQMSTR